MYRARVDILRRPCHPRQWSQISSGQWTNRHFCLRSLSDKSMSSLYMKKRPSKTSPLNARTLSIARERQNISAPVIAGTSSADVESRDATHLSPWLRSYHFPYQV